MPTLAEPRPARRRVRGSDELWPSLGATVCDFIENYCVHGPGDVRGGQVTLTPEERVFIWRAYEVAPKGHPKEGRRRWNRAAYVRRKGVRKTEFAAWLTCAELLAPVRFDGWDSKGEPTGRTITSPYIPVAATSLEQVDDTLWGAVYAIISEGPLCDEFALDIGLDRIIELATGGEAKPVTASSVARDGGKPTFSPRDETHLWYAPELRRLNDVLLRNLPKRPTAEPWALATTTAWAPGQGSVAEDEAAEADKQASGHLPPNTLLWDMRRASDKWDLGSDGELHKALIEASGDALPWTDIDLFATEFRRGSLAEGKRYFLSIPASIDTDESWLADHPGVFEECRVAGVALDPNGTQISVGVDAALRSDSVAVWALQERADGRVVGEVRTWVAADGRMYDRAALRNHLRDLTARFRVKGIGYDPKFLESDAQELEDEGLPMVEVPQSPERMVPACRVGYELIVSRTLAHDADEVSTSQVVAAVPREADGGWRLSKGKSKKKIDSSIALCIAEYIRVVMAGEEPSMYENSPMRVL